MFNLDDLPRQAHDGDVVEGIAQRFGLSRAQAESAIDALMPAMAMGFQRAARSHEGFGQIFAAMPPSPPRAAERADDLSPQSAPEGVQALSMLFGSKGVSREVATQASFASGLPPQILKAILPVLASLLMSALSRRAQAGGLGGIGGILGPLAGVAMGGKSGGTPSRGPRADGALPDGRDHDGQNAGGGLSDILGSLLGGRASEEPAPRDVLPADLSRPDAAHRPDPVSHDQSAQNHGDSDSLGAMLDQLGYGPDAGSETSESKAPTLGEIGGLGDLLGRMFQTKQTLQPAQQDALSQIFERMTRH